LQGQAPCAHQACVRDFNSCGNRVATWTSLICPSTLYAAARACAGSFTFGNYMFWVLVLSTDKKK